jgi:hypothetical protein
MLAKQTAPDARRGEMKIRITLVGSDGGTDVRCMRGYRPVCRLPTTRWAGSRHSRGWPHPAKRDRKRVACASVLVSDESTFRGRTIGPVG